VANLDDRLRQELQRSLRPADPVELYEGLSTRHGRRRVARKVGGAALVVVVLAMAAGADFIKTSTGKVQPAATLPVTLVMLEAIRDFEKATGRAVGMKPAGGIRTAKEAIQYLVVLYETLGREWMTPDLFRFGASSLLNDVLMQLRKEKTGRYQSGDYFTID